MSTRTGPGIRSDAPGLTDLIGAFTEDGCPRGQLVLHEPWPRRWSTTWQFDGGQVVWPVRDLGSVPVLSSQPLRRFTWRARQRHRPGLEFLVSTGRQYGFESLEERDLLLALDFVQVREVLPQPFRLEFEHADGHSAHMSDFLALMPDGIWLFDVRPATLVRYEDAVKLAATREVAAAAGWHYSVVGGWRRHVQSVLDALSARRRPRKGPLGLQPQLLAAVVENGERRNQMLAGQDHEREATWRERRRPTQGHPHRDPLPAQARIGELLGEVQDLRAHRTE
ncbi:hypothetical protein [Kitasatospora purpeofusca]|uniref:hypothetical protein n=1 Tax=Kitasatospora purpeofusca TaxID=67352 RepID=UPI002A59D7E4|nr:hypothetical protein [Kitasatospora purpeofusca]MDY0814831.1 hypothetical protein [Kitasatospora purpeofusca]